jgi:hypothetical protein
MTGDDNATDGSRSTLWHPAMTLGHGGEGGSAVGNEARDGELAGLADAIAEVRRELAEAEAEGARSDWRFQVDRVTLEFAVELHRTGEGRLSLRLGVVEAGAGGSATRVGTHRMQLELVPHGEAGERPVGR